MRRILRMDDGTEYELAGGTVGLGLFDDSIRTGHDAYLDSPSRDDDDRLPLQHRVEIAEHMIAAWNAYRWKLTEEVVENPPRASL